MNTLVCSCGSLVELLSTFRSLLGDNLALASHTRMGQSHIFGHWTCSGKNLASLRFLTFSFFFPSGPDLMSFLVRIIHGEVAYFKCTLCNKMAKHKGSMRRHMVLIHGKPTNDVCEYCKRVFKHKYYLREHLRKRECLSGMLFQTPQ